MTSKRCSIAPTGPIACSEPSGHAGPHVWGQRKNFAESTPKSQSLSGLPKELRNIAVQVGDVGGWRIAGLKILAAADEIERLTAALAACQTYDYRTLADEVERLQADLAIEREQLADLTKRWGAVVDDRERLRAALTEYGVHGSSCEPDNCVCGLRELLNGYGIETCSPQNSTRAVSALEDIPVKGTAGTNPIPEVQELIDRLRHRATRAEHGADVRVMDDAADFLERFRINQRPDHE